MIELLTLGTIDLRDETDRSLSAVLAQPKRLALLAFLASGYPRRAHRRDAVVSVFWPDSDSENARAALRKTIFRLRQSLGEDVITGDEEIALTEVIGCDAARFEQLAGSGRYEAALQLYQGDFLPGLYINDAVEFERWLDGERARLRALAIECAWTAADDAERAGRRSDALVFGRRAVEISGVDDAAMARLLHLHERLGDGTGGARVFDEYRARLQREFELEPSIALLAQAASLTQTTRPHAVVSADPVARPMARRKRFAVAAALVVTAAIVWFGTGSRNQPVERPVLAIGTIRDLTRDTSGLYEQALPDLLATNLARAADIQVISGARMQELLALQPGAESPAGVAQAARRAGATQLIEGALYKLPDGGLRLDLRRVDLGSGAVTNAETVSARDLFAVVDRATQQVLENFRAAAPVLRIADVTTRSLIAHKYYQQGLRILYQQGDAAAAHQFFRSALEEDSTFAMAAYFLGLQSLNLHRPDARDYLLRAARLAERTSDRERLLIRAAWADIDNSPARIAIAETLAVRYPSEPAGPLILGRGLMWSGEFLRAVPYFERVLALDSVGLRGERPLCRACDALFELTNAYLFADSGAAAVRVARRLTRERPQAAGSWDMLANALESGGQFDQAAAARRKLTTLTPAAVFPQIYPAVLALRTGDFERADRILSTNVQNASGELRNSSLWYYVLSLRWQGRHREALAAAREYARISAATASSATLARLLEAIVLAEMQRAPDAARLFESMAAEAATRQEIPAVSARIQAWNLTHAATALAAARDTSRLTSIADRVERLGKLSAYGRDARLHHYVRGLLLAARHQPAAAESAFAASIFSPTVGYTRANLELARAAMQLDRPETAIAMLQAAFRNAGLGASTLYVTHSELHEALGQAFAQAGRADSAALHYRWVARAWQRADPQLHARRDAAEARATLHSTRAP